MAFKVIIICGLTLILTQLLSILIVVSTVSLICVCVLFLIYLESYPTFIADYRLQLNGSEKHAAVTSPPLSITNCGLGGSMLENLMR